VSAHCRYHCRSCEGHFTSLEAFDQHRPRNPSAGGCEWPENAPLIEISGCCKIDDPDRPRFGVTLYGTERAERARRYFGGDNGRQAAPAIGKLAVAV
jgi:hypothetical protein